MRLVLVLAWLVATLTIQVQAVETGGWKRILETFIQRDWSAATDTADFGRRASELQEMWRAKSYELVGNQKISKYNNRLPEDIRLDQATFTKLKPYFEKLALNVDARSPEGPKTLSSARYIFLLTYAGLQHNAKEAGQHMDQAAAARNAFQEADDYLNPSLWSTDKGLEVAYKLFRLAKLRLEAEDAGSPDAMQFRRLLDQNRIEPWRVHQAAIESTTLRASDGWYDDYAGLVRLRRKAVNDELSPAEGQLAPTVMHNFVRAKAPRYLEKVKAEDQKMFEELMPSFLQAALQAAGGRPRGSAVTFMHNVLERTQPPMHVVKKYAHLNPTASLAKIKAGPASQIKSSVSTSASQRARTEASGSRSLRDGDESGHRGPYYRYGGAESPWHSPPAYGGPYSGAPYPYGYHPHPPPLYNLGPAHAYAPAFYPSDSEASHRASSQRGGFSHTTGDSGFDGFPSSSDDG